jgi:hypothetical protein
VESGESSFCPQHQNKSKGKKTQGLEIQPFVAVSVETTGIPSRGECDILEISLVFGDYGQLGSGLKRSLHLYIQPKNEEYTWQEGTYEITGGIAEAILNGEVESVTLDEARDRISNFLQECREISGVWKNILTGMNLDSLIIPMLKMSHLYDDDLIDHNSLDFRTLFYFQVRRRAQLEEIAKALNVPIDEDSMKNTWGKAVVILSCLFEEMGRVTGKQTHSWY